MATIIEKSKKNNFDEKNKVVLKDYFNESEKQTEIDSKECGNVPFREIKKSIFNPNNYDKVVDYIIVDYCSLFPAIRKMQDLY